MRGVAVEKVLDVLLVDDHVLFRSGLAALLLTDPGVRIVGEAGDGLEAIELARETIPDLILMDVHMPHCDGLQAVRTIKHEMPRVKIIMLTADAEDAILFESIKSGAEGYLLKILEPKGLMDMMHAVVGGGIALSPAMMAKILDEFNHPPKENGPELAIRETLTAARKRGPRAHRYRSEQLGNRGHVDDQHRYGEEAPGEHPDQVTRSKPCPGGGIRRERGIDSRKIEPWAAWLGFYLRSMGRLTHENNICLSTDPSQRWVCFVFQDQPGGCTARTVVMLE